MWGVGWGGYGTGMADGCGVWGGVGMVPVWLMDVGCDGRLCVDMLYDIKRGLVCDPSPPGLHACGKLRQIFLSTAGHSARAWSAASLRLACG